MVNKEPSIGQKTAQSRIQAEAIAKDVFSSFQRDLAAPESTARSSFSQQASTGDLSSRMGLLKKASRLANEQLAMAFDVSVSTFKGWLRKGGSDPSLKNLIKIQDVTGIALQWIATGDGPMFGFSHPGAAMLPAPSFVYVPRYDVRVGAGTGQVVESENITGFLAFREDWVRTRLRRNPVHLVVIEVFGDSMYPTIKDGDIILVDTSEDRVRGPAIYVVLAGNEAIVKRVELKIDGSLLVKSDNPNYETMTLRGDQAHELRVLGKVVWTGGLV